MRTHTQGPWIHNDYQIVSASGRIIANCTYGSRNSNNENDARLIAAAPDLLDALQKLVDINTKHNEAINAVIQAPVGWKDSYLDDARAAIKKAIGESA